MVATPRSIDIVMYGNPVIWSTAALAAGTLLGWPAVFVILKPSLAPLAIWGIRRRSWWIALAVAIVAALPFGAMRLEWIQMRSGQQRLAALQHPGPLLRPPPRRGLARSATLVHERRDGSPRHAGAAPEQEGPAAILRLP